MAIVLLALGRNCFLIGQRNLRAVSKAKVIRVDTKGGFLQEFSSFIDMDCEKGENSEHDEKICKVKRKMISKNESKEETKEHPNCFLSIPILSDQIKAKFSEIQIKMAESEPKLKSLMISVPTIHLTLEVYNLKEQQIISARKAMDEAKGKIMAFTNSLPLRMDVSGIGSFGSEVVFAKVVPGPQLDLIYRVAEELHNSFKEIGLECTGSQPFNPHITILKLSRGNYSLRKSLKTVVPNICETFKEENFGIELANRVDLCSMTEKKGPDGYYHIMHQIKLTDADN